MATPEHFLWHARQADDAGDVSEFLSAVIVDEKSEWDYNRGISSNDGVTKQAGQPPREPLLAIYPSDGVLVADKTTGYRTIQDKMDPAVASAGHCAQSLQPVPLPSADVLVNVQKSFPNVRKRARAMFLLDVSGSMGQEIAPGVTVSPFKTNKGDLLAKLNALEPVAATPLFEAVGRSPPNRQANTTNPRSTPSCS